MSKKAKILILLTAFVFCLSAFSITVFADDVISEDPVIEETYPDTPAEQPTEYVPDVTEAPIADNPDYGTSSDDDNSYDYSDQTSDYNQGSVTEDSYYNDGDSNDYNSDYNNNYDYNEYVPDFESDDYVIEETQAVIDSELYDVKDKIDDSELSDSDWNAIAKSLENASNTGSGDDFNFIKKNTSKSDNGLWILIVGALLIILAIVGITYVILSSLNKKKAYAYPSGGTSTKQSGSRSANTYRTRPSNDYNDGYSSTPRLSRRKRMDDTADIKLPRNSGGNHYR